MSYFHEEADRRFYRKPIDQCLMPLPFLRTGFGWGYAHRCFGPDYVWQFDLAPTPSDPHSHRARLPDGQGWMVADPRPMASLWRETDTVTTYTGNTPQTGDSFVRIGAAGAGLTNIDLPNQTIDITAMLMLEDES